jgi:hypothetical protein
LGADGRFAAPVAPGKLCMCKKMFPTVPIVALTATATSKVHGYSHEPLILSRRSTALQTRKANNGTAPVSAAAMQHRACNAMQCNAQRALPTQVREDVLTALAMPSAKVLLASFDRQRRIATAVDYRIARTCACTARSLHSRCTRCSLTRVPSAARCGVRWNPAGGPHCTRRCDVATRCAFAWTRTRLPPRRTGGRTRPEIEYSVRYSDLLPKGKFSDLKAFVKACTCRLHVS